MKKQIAFFFLLAALCQVNAQKPFPQVYKSAWPVNVDSRYSNPERTLALGGDMKAISMMDATNGNILWTMTFKEKLGVKKAEDWGWNSDAGYVWVKIETDEKNVYQTLYYDERTAEKIDDISTRTEKVRVKTKKQRVKHMYSASVSDPERNIYLELEYQVKIAGSAMGKGTKTDLTLKSSGPYSWSTSFQGKLIRALCQNAVGSLYGDEWGGDYINVMLHGNYAFVVYEGISAFDVTNGKLLWETSFDNADLDFGAIKSTQILGKAGVPVITDDGVYVADLSKGVYKIKKLDLKTGSVIWESEKLDKGSVIPDMVVVGGTLVARFGGEIETQTMVMDMNTGNVKSCTVLKKMTGPFGIRAFDTKSGKMLWTTFGNKSLGDKFKGSISNILVSGSNVVFATNANLFCMDATSGNVVYKTNISKSGVGLTNYIWLRNNAVIAEGTTGVASLNFADGKYNFGVNTKKHLGSFGTEDAFYIWVGKKLFEEQDFVRVDLETGAVNGIQKDTRYPQWTPDYEEFLKYDGSKVYRFKTRS